MSQRPNGTLATTQYDAAGRKTTVLLGEGTTRLLSFDALGQTTRIVEQTWAGAALASSTYTYDGVGNRVGILWGSGMLTTYQYDAKDRLIQDATSVLNTHTYNYTYDGADNRLTSNETGNLATSTFDAAQRLVTSVEAGIGTTTYTYSSPGDLTNVANPDGSLVTMAYYSENRLRWHQFGASAATYTYDGDGKKRGEGVDGTTTTLVWDGDDYLQGRS